MSVNPTPMDDSQERALLELFQAIASRNRPQHCGLLIRSTSLHDGRFESARRGRGRKIISSRTYLNTPTLETPRFTSRPRPISGTSPKS